MDPYELNHLFFILPNMYTTLGLKNSAIKRLYSDMAELLQDPVWRASALPLSDNIFEWHANICGPKGSGFENVPLHFVMTFSEQYPASKIRDRDRVERRINFLFF